MNISAQKNFQIWSSDIFQISKILFYIWYFFGIYLLFPAEIFMVKPGFVVFRQRRYFLQKISSKNIAGANNYEILESYFFSKKKYDLGESSISLFNQSQSGPYLSCLTKQDI